MDKRPCQEEPEQNSVRDTSYRRSGKIQSLRWGQGVGTDLHREGAESLGTNIQEPQALGGIPASLNCNLCLHSC